MKKIHVTLQPDQKLFFTSDLHVGHKNVLKFCNRPFLDIKDMSKGLIENWNRVVGENDIVFDLGDMFWFDSRHDVKKFVEQLNGFIYKIPGNHDMDCKRLFELCLTNKITVLDDSNVVWVEREGQKTVEIWLSHFPLATWPHWTHGSLNFFGHIHSGPLTDNMVDIPGKDLNLKAGQQYDVGVDNNDYTPVSLQYILQILESQKNPISIE